MGLVVAGVDEGGTISTEEFHATHPPDEGLAPRYQDLFDQMHLALTTNDRQAVGRISTASAILHQSILPKRCYDRAPQILDEVNGYGLCVAHTGTLIGILLASDDPSLKEKVQYVQQVLGLLAGVRALPLLTILE